MIRRMAYMKYTIFDTVTQRLYIGVLSPKRSPLVQSGDMSHHANMIAGEMMAVIIPSIILSPSIRLLYIFVASVDVVSFLAGSAAGVVVTAACTVVDIS